MTDPTNRGPAGPQRFLSIDEVCKRENIARSTFYARNPPEPDALIGKTRGWLPETIDAWGATIPTPGRYSRPRGERKREE